MFFLLFLLYIVRISEEVVVSPGPSVTTSFVANGITLVAENTERYRFDHWSSSVELPGLDPLLPSQHLIEVCWPLEDTVRFTAWYRDATVSVDEDPGGNPRIALQGRTLEVDGSGSPIVTVAVSDVHGRLVAWRESVDASVLHLSLTAPPGVYLVAVRTARTATILPLLYSP